MTTTRARTRLRLSSPILAAVWVILYGLGYGFDDPQTKLGLAFTRCLPCLAPVCCSSCRRSCRWRSSVWFKKNGGGNVFTTLIAPAVFASSCRSGWSTPGWQSRDIGRHQRIRAEHSLCRPCDHHRRPHLGLCPQVVQSSGLQEHWPYGARRRVTYRLLTKARTAVSLLSSFLLW